MSDISIPGVTGKYNSQETIKKLVELERVRLTRMEDSVKSLETQKSHWREVNADLARVRESARALVGFETPFNERAAMSSDESVLTAVATRGAPESATEIRVRQLAQADRFRGRPVAEDFQVPAGTYGFRVGEKEVSFAFRGGRLQAFAQALNERARDLLRASVVRNAPGTLVLVIEGRQTGAENGIEFTKDSTSLGEAVGLIRRALTGARDLPVGEAGRERVFAPGDRLSIPVSPAVPIGDNHVLEMEIRVRRLPAESYIAPQPPPGPSVPPPPGTTFGDVTVESSPSEAVLPEWKPPEAPPIVDDLNILAVRDGTRSVPLPALYDTDDYMTLRIPLKDYVASVSAIEVANNNTFREVAVKSARIFDPTLRGDFEPVSPVTTARDALVEVDGVPVQRPTNAISDVVAGLTLNLAGTSDRPVRISVEPNREAVKNALIQFVGTYNQLIRNINILTRNDPGIVNEIEFLDDDEKKSAMERLGAMDGDITLMQMKSRLQTIMMNVYPTRSSPELSLLSQIGISTNSRTGAGFDATKLRGYLEIDETKLDGRLRSDILAVKDLFSRDTDGDLVMDSGVAVNTEANARPYVQTGGIISTRLSALDSQIARTNRSIEDYNNYLARFESDLRRKYGRMEGALESLEKSSQAIENFNRSGSNSR